MERYANLARPATRRLASAVVGFLNPQETIMNYSAALLIVMGIAALAVGLVLGTTAAACYCGG